MEDSELLNLWKSYDKKLEENLILNKKNAEEITKLKVESFLGSMKPLKIFTILAGLVWIVLVDIVLIAVWKHASIFFLVSIGLQVLLTKLAVGIYIYQLVLLNEVNNTDPIVITQQKIASLKATTIWIARILFLQIPVWTTFYWTVYMWKHGSSVLLFFQALITLVCIYLSVWLFINIKYENRDKKWFKLMFEGKEWTPAVKSMELLNQLKEYK